MCEKYSRGCWFVLMNILKFAIYVADVVTDIMLAVEYYCNGDTHWFGLTLGFALVPQFIMNMIMWYQEGMNPSTFVLYFLQIGIAVKYIQLVFGVCCCYNEIGPHDPENIREDREHSDDDRVLLTVRHFLPLVHLIGSLLESVPQICLQLHVYIVTGTLERMEIDTLKYVSILVSLVAAVKSVLDWEMHILTGWAWPRYGVPFALWKVVELCSRILAISVLSSVKKYAFMVYVFVGLHWSMMAVIEGTFGSSYCDIWVPHPDNDGTCMPICFNLFIVSPFDILAWATFGSRSLNAVQPILNGIVTFGENYAMVLLWYLHKDVSAWYDLHALMLPLAGTAFSLVFLKPICLFLYPYEYVRNDIDW